MDINNSLFLPDFHENTNGELCFLYSTGEITKIPKEYSEILSQHTIENIGHDYNYLSKAFWDRRNPLVKEECENCHNKITRMVISNKQKIFVCECETIKFGNKLE